MPLKAYEILEKFTGKDLEYKEYEPLFACAGEAAAKQNKKGHFVTCDSYVTMSDGTGIVHIAPAFGEDDARVGRTYDLPFLQLVDSKGEMTEDTDYAGVFCKKADPMILSDLSKEGKLFAALVDALDEVASEISDLEEEIEDVEDDLDELEEYIEEVDEALGDVEEFVYDIEDDCDCCCDDEDYYEILCPSCGETICFDESAFDDESLVCPACGSEIGEIFDEDEVDLESEDEE